MRAINRLSALKVRNLAKPGRYGDGAGLYLQIARGGSKQWIFRYQRGGQSRQMGLGSVRAVSLAEARRKAALARATLDRGADPIEIRRAETRSNKGPNVLTFQQAAERYVASHENGWKNAAHRRQWRSTLETYAFPELGEINVAAVDTALVLKVLEPIWATKTESAVRIRGRIESIIDWARARGLFAGENPARWRGHLDKLLAPPSRLRRVRHQPALAFKDIPAFMRQLRRRQGVAARALEFTILTAARTNECINAQWREIDLSEQVWTIPAERMKAGRPHRVPLAPRALELLSGLPREGENGGFVFVGGSKGKPLSNMAMLALLKTMRSDVTVHGFRSSFRDWTRETTNYARDVAEAALAHIIKDDAEAAYARGDLLEKRRSLMNDWAEYCGRR